ncbi:MAG: hypothetical protein REI09_11540 [Candidatus Dactylopiibacterium sp.]|nr:hypothetical protein [Candidatus Dactylopiibacterium sp.]
MSPSLARLLLACWMTLCGGAFAAEPMHFIHPPPENADDRRYTYYWELLDAALRVTRADHGDYRITPYPTPMNFSRAVAEVEAARPGGVNITTRATNFELETRLRAIPLPLDKGLLGYRMFLVTPETQHRLDAEVRNLDDLKHFRIGQNRAWTDSLILGDNGFRLVLTDSYEGLFPMLAAKRFDLLSRGVIEIADEWKTYRRSLPELRIEQHLLLVYPMPRYFFVARTPEGERMAVRITEGLLRLARSGEFDRLYTGYKKAVLAGLELSGRRVFRLTNTQLSRAAPPPDDPFWWDRLGPELAGRGSAQASAPERR